MSNHIGIESSLHKYLVQHHTYSVYSCMYKTYNLQNVLFVLYHVKCSVYILVFLALVVIVGPNFEIRIVFSRPKPSCTQGNLLISKKDVLILKHDNLFGRGGVRH